MESVLHNLNNILNDFQLFEGDRRTQDRLICSIRSRSKIMFEHDVALLPSARYVCACRRGLLK